MKGQEEYAWCVVWELCSPPAARGRVCARAGLYACVRACVECVRVPCPAWLGPASHVATSLRHATPMRTDNDSLCDGFGGITEFCSCRVPRETQPRCHGSAILVVHTVHQHVHTMSDTSDTSSNDSGTASGGDHDAPTSPSAAHAAHAPARPRHRRMPADIRRVIRERQYTLHHVEAPHPAGITARVRLMAARRDDDFSSELRRVRAVHRPVRPALSLTVSDL